MCCQKIKYAINNFTVRCPECDDLITMGTCGSNGLVEHQGKSKCITTVKQKAKEDKSKRNHTLFGLGITQGRDTGVNLNWTTPLVVAPPPVFVAPQLALRKFVVHKQCNVLSVDVKLNGYAGDHFLQVVDQL